jgi:hypothetical protein
VSNFVPRSFGITVPVKFVDNHQSEDDSELIIDLDMLQVRLPIQTFFYGNIRSWTLGQDFYSLEPHLCFPVYPVPQDPAASHGGGCSTSEPSTGGEEDITTESVDSIEYTPVRKTTNQPASSFSSQKSKKTVKFNELIDNEVREALLRYDQIIGDISDGGTESLSLSEASEGSGAGEGEGGVHRMLDDIHQLHSLPEEELNR